MAVRITGQPFYNIGLDEWKKEMSNTNEEENKSVFAMAGYSVFRHADTEVDYCLAHTLLSYVIKNLCKYFRQICINLSIVVCVWNTQAIK